MDPPALLTRQGFVWDQTDSPTQCARQSLANGQLPRTARRSRDTIPNPRSSVSSGPCVPISSRSLIGNLFAGDNPVLLMSFSRGTAWSCRRSRGINRWDPDLQIDWPWFRRIAAAQSAPRSVKSASEILERIGLRRRGQSQKAGHCGVLSVKVRDTLRSTKMIGLNPGKKGGPRRNGITCDIMGPSHFGAAGENAQIEKDKKLGGSARFSLGAASCGAGAQRLQGSGRNMSF